MSIISDGNCLKRVNNIFMKIQSNNYSEKSIKILSIEFFRFLYSVIVDQGLPDMQ